jgi:hypothetical protein
MDFVKIALLGVKIVLIISHVLIATIHFTFTKTIVLNNVQLDFIQVKPLLLLA